jgi:hypothetical protein
VIEKMASYAQSGAVETSCSLEDLNANKIGTVDCGWEVEGGCVEVRLSHGRGISNNNGPIITNCSTHHIGQFGFGGDAGVISGCEIACNNHAGFATGWGAGGGKWVVHYGHLEISDCLRLDASYNLCSKLGSKLIF